MRARPRVGAQRLFAQIDAPELDRLLSRDLRAAPTAAFPRRLRSHNSISIADSSKMTRASADVHGGTPATGESGSREPLRPAVVREDEASDESGGE